jgi:3-oxoacyl-[acyl-carrier protein] reductase
MPERVALVTGAGAGVGRAVALRLARSPEVATVVVNDIDADLATDVAAEVETAGADGRVAVADVTSWDAVQQMFAAYGPVDVLVNNAGVPPGDQRPAPFARSSPTDWRPWLALNLDAVLYCTRAALPGMLAAGWGRVITVISDAARVGEAGLATYSAGKAGAAGFTRALAREVGRSGVTCNCVALGTIKHGRIADYLSGDVEQKMLRHYVSPRLGTPDDAAAMIGFLAGPEADWITGQTYPVNGGFSLAM